MVGDNAGMVSLICSGSIDQASSTIEFKNQIQFEAASEAAGADGADAAGADCEADEAGTLLLSPASPPCSQLVKHRSTIFYLEVLERSNLIL
jgi:hypothetical protein